MNAKKLKDLLGLVPEDSEVMMFAQCDGVDTEIEAQSIDGYLVSNHENKTTLILTNY